MSIGKVFDEPPATVPEVAHYLGTTPQVVRTWLSAKRFPELNRIAIRLGRSVRFDWQDLRTFRESLKGRGVNNVG